MATQPWKYLINTFYAKTVNTIKNALSLTVDHMAKLTANEADADIAAIKTAYEPIHDSFVAVYNQLQSRLGLYKGKTQSFEDLMEELMNTKLNEWRGQVFAVFAEGTADASAIFPRDRQPFSHGTYEQRVEAVETLATTLATYTAKPTLITLGLAVEAHHTVLLGARALQQTDEGSTATLRTNLKNAHILLCMGLYRNLGLLMAKYAETPLTVANYFDLKLLRTLGKTKKVTLEIDVAVGEIGNFDFTGLEIDFEKVLSGEFKSHLSKGDFYAGETAVSPPGDTVLSVPAEETTLREGEDLSTLLGADETHTFINVKNTGLLPGHYTLVLTVEE